MSKYRVWVNYMVRCSASGCVYVEARDEEEAMDIAESLRGDIEDGYLEEEEIIGAVEAVYVEEL